MCDTFPTDTCVLVCSGPSLNLVDPFELGLPVVAISTAIRKITNPHYWILADNLNEMHEKEGTIAYQNENIKKIVPVGKVSGKHRNIIRNFCEYEYASSDNSINDRDSHLFSGKLPFLRGPHKTVTFAVQWLYYVGVRNVIWVGNDLHAKSAQEKYAYESNAVDLKKAYNYNVTIQQVHDTIKSWYQISKSRNLNFNWYSWKCGSVFEEFVSPFDYDSYEKPQESIYYQPAQNSLQEFHEIETPEPQVKKKERIVTRDIGKSKTIPQARKIKIKEPQQIEKSISVVEEPKLIQTKPIIQKTIKSSSTPNVRYPKYKQVVMGDAQSQAKRIKDALR